MSHSEREIRVFLSSTFRDMDAERTHLIKQVFPKVRAACQARQVGFTEIDLRWGVTEEEAKNGATVEICLKEIDRCRDFPPFFIGFLGERYGWIPRHEELQSYWGKQADTKYEHQILEAVKQRISVTELEMQLAVLQHGAAGKLHGHALFLLRDPKLTDTHYTEQTGKAPDHQDTAFYDAGRGKLAALKDNIRKSGYLGVDSYTSVEQFGEAIEQYLLAQLNHYFPADEVPTPQERSNAAHQTFRFHRLQNFLPRKDVRALMLQAINQRIESPYLGPILVTGPSGQGKSALMADLARYLQTGTHKTNNPSNRKETWRVIDHYIGADSANSVDNWVDRILNTLHPDIKDIAGDIPETPKGRVEALSTWLSMAARRHNCRYLLILDALDQLSDGGKNLDILTSQTLGPDGILIASAADDTPARNSAANWNTPIEVPSLTNELRKQIIQDTLKRYRKELPPELATRLASAPQSGSPLFLILALEELRVDARHETLAPTTEAILKQPNAEQLFLNNFLLDADNGRPEMSELAASFMALLGASRAGLSELELADLLAQPDDPIAEDTGKPRMPQIHLSKLLNNLAPFLLNKGGNRAPMHRIFGEAALNYYGTWPVRKHLYAHFSPGYGQGFTDPSFNARQAAEALHQITKLAELELQSGPEPGQYVLQLQYDLQTLSLVSRLHQAVDGQPEDEEVLFNAFNRFSHEQKAAIAEHWPAQIKFETEDDLDAYGWTVGNFANWFYEKIGHAKAAKALQEIVLEARQRILGEEHPDTLTSMGNLAATLSAMGDLPGARTLAEKVLEASQRILGEEHPDTLRAMGNLAGTLLDQGDLPGARTLAEKVLEARQRILGEEHPDTLRAMGNLAGTLLDQGDLPGARTLEEKVLEARQRILGEEHPETLISMDNLAGTLRDQGDLPGARTLGEKVLEASQRILGEEHPDTLRAMSNLAATLHDMGDLPGARTLGEKVLEARQRILGEEHPDTLTAMGNLAGTLRALGDLPGARTLAEKVLEARQRILGEEHPDTLRAMSNLAATLHDMGDLPGARTLEEKVLEARQRIQGEEHPDTLRAISNLAATLHDMGDLPGARTLEGKVLEALQRIQGEEHPDTLTAMANLAVTLSALGDLPGARTLEEKVLEARQRILGEEHPDTLISMDNLAVTLRDLGDLPGARTLEEKVLEARQRILGEEHPDMLISMGNLAVTLRALGDLPGARTLEEKVLDARQRILGEAHPDTLRAMSNLAYTLDAQGDLPGALALFQKALAVEQRILGEEHPDTLNTMDRLAVYLEQVGDIDELVKIRTRQILILENTVGRLDQKAIQVLQNLAVALRNAGRLENAEPHQRDATARLIDSEGGDSLAAASGYSALGNLLKLKGQSDEAEALYRHALAIRERELGADAEPTKLVRTRLDELLNGKWR